MRKPICGAVYAATIALTGCGGGGSAGGGSLPASAPGIAHFTISDPYASPSDSRRRDYFSPATALILIAANGKSAQLPLSASSPSCSVVGGTINYAVDMPEPNGPLNFFVQTLDASGATLSQVSGSATIDGKTAVPLALQGIWKTAMARLSNETPLMGSPSVISVSVSAYDVDDALIIGPEPYTMPIPLYNSDQSGATMLSTTTVAQPREAVTLSYDEKSYVNATVSAAVPPSNASSAQDTLVPALPITEYASPSGNFTNNGDGIGRLILNADGSIGFMEQKFIGRITTSGQISETPIASNYFDMVTGSDRNMWLLVPACNPACIYQDNHTLARVNVDGSLSPLPMFPVPSDGPAIVGTDGDFWLPALGQGPTSPVALQIAPSGAAADFAAAGGGNGTTDLVQASDGNFWFVDSNSLGTNFVRMTPSGAVTVYPLPVSLCCGEQSNVAEGPDGEVYMLSASAQAALVRIATSGSVSQLPIDFASVTSFGGKEVRNALAAGPDGALWLSMGINHNCQPQVQRITPSGSHATLVLPVVCNNLDGPAAQVSALLAAPDGNLWYTRGTSVGKIALPH